MLEVRKAARQRLKDCTRTEYDSFTHEAKLTPIQKQITDMHIIYGLQIREIASRLLLCESLVRKRLAETYDKISKV